MDSIEALTEQEILDAIASAMEHSPTPDGYYTTLELCELTGLNEKIVRRRLRNLINKGRMRTVKTRRINIAGVLQPTPAYCFVKGTDSDGEIR